MKNPSRTILTKGSLALNKYFHHFFDDEPYQHQLKPVEQVLPPQPVRQRKLFTRLAIEDHREIFMQLNPLTSDGEIINCRGTLSKLANGRFILQNQNISYIFSLEQIRYIAG